jgi:hypothetical protein
MLEQKTRHNIFTITKYIKTSYRNKYLLQTYNISSDSDRNNRTLNLQKHIPINTSHDHSVFGPSSETVNDTLCDIEYCIMLTGGIIQLVHAIGSHPHNTFNGPAYHMPMYNTPVDLRRSQNNLTPDRVHDTVFLPNIST